MYIRLLSLNSVFIQKCLRGQEPSKQTQWWMRFQNQVSIALYISTAVMHTQKELDLGSDAVSVILPIGAYTQWTPLFKMLKSE